MENQHPSFARATRTARAMQTAIAMALGLIVLAPGLLRAQDMSDPAPQLAAQRQAMQALDRMDGLWRGPAWTLRPDGSKHHITQTERIGPFLAGTLKLIEGRGYEADGRVSFNAFGVVSYDARRRAFQMQSHAQGHAGTFVFTLTDDGYIWSVPAGPDTVLRYTAVIRNDELVEVGDREVSGRPPERVFEMRLKRLGSTTWPDAGSVPPR